MEPRRRILTFNWHEAYVSMVASTGHHFDVLQRDKAGLWFWLYTTRPVPPNVSLVHLEDARRRLRRGEYDLAICHTPLDVELLEGSGVPAVLVFHNYLQTEAELCRTRGDRHLSERPGELERLLDRARPVFISEGKRDSWGVDGEVVLPGIDDMEFRGYRGDALSVLRVGNFLLERDLMLGGRLQEEVLRGVPHQTLGLNASIRGAGLSASYDALREAYRSHRAFLHTTRPGREDGYNLALLEAMSSGMPVVTLEHPTSPVEHEVSGLVGASASELRGHVMRLLEDQDLAARLGEQARKTVRERFPMEAFRDRWSSIIESASVAPPSVSASSSVGTVERQRVLMVYCAYPATTARYLERSLRKDHLVVTAGPTIPPEVWSRWNLERLREPARPQDISVGGDATLAQIWELLPPGFDPDVVLWVETGLGAPPPDLADAPVPTLGYLIDTHFHRERHLEWASSFDQVFLAQKAYVEEFRTQGHRTEWLPLGCDPEIHRPGALPIEFDVGFVGSLVEPRRVRLIEELMGHFRVYVDRWFLEDMALAFSRSHIVWNNAANEDLNMRVFEALAAGSFLLTERLPEEAGLGELFEDGEHLALYDEDELVERARYYLERPEERARIAERGRAEALAHHTYDHRVARMLEVAATLPRREQAEPATAGA